MGILRCDEDGVVYLRAGTAQEQRQRAAALVGCAVHVMRPILGRDCEAGTAILEGLVWVDEAGMAKYRLASRVDHPSAAARAARADQEWIIAQARRERLDLT